MNNLKRLRERARLSQTAVASAIGTTQQTYQRWETGKGQLPIEAVQKLAVFFKVPLAKVIGIPDGAVMHYGPDVIIASHFNNSFWGHLGLQLTGKANSLWFPLAGGEKDRLYDQLEDLDAEEEILTIPTLDNRELFCRPDAVTRFRLLDDACDKPSDDPAWSWMENRPLRDPTGLEVDLYRGMTAIALCDDTGLQAFDEEVAAKARDHIQQLALKDDDLFTALCETTIHMVDGTIIRTMLASDGILDFADDLEHSFPDATISFTDRNGCLDFVRMDRIALVDMPSCIYYSAMTERYPPDHDMPLDAEK